MLDNFLTQLKAEIFIYGVLAVFAGICLWHFAGAVLEILGDLLKIIGMLIFGIVFRLFQLIVWGFRKAFALGSAGVRAWRKNRQSA